jgi:hypothetical protein
MLLPRRIIFSFWDRQSLWPLEQKGQRTRIPLRTWKFVRVLSGGGGFGCLRVSSSEIYYATGRVYLCPPHDSIQSILERLERNRYKYLETSPYWLSAVSIACPLVLTVASFCLWALEMGLHEPHGLSGLDSPAGNQTLIVQPPAKHFIDWVITVSPNLIYRVIVLKRNPNLMSNAILIPLVLKLWVAWSTCMMDNGP